MGAKLSNNICNEEPSDIIIMADQQGLEVLTVSLRQLVERQGGCRIHHSA